MDFRPARLRSFRHYIVSTVFEGAEEVIELFKDVPIADTIADMYEDYQRLIKKNMARVKALVALSRKLVRVLFALVRDQRSYVSEPPVILHKKAA